jgi:hypothetical protein
MKNILVYVIIFLTVAILVIFLFLWYGWLSKAYAPDIYELGGVIITKQEYDIQKTSILDKMSTDKKLTYDEAKKWRSIAEREIAVCKLVFKGVNKDNIVSKINARLATCSK